jgi:hypothetical protein
MVKPSVSYLSDDKRIGAGIRQPRSCCVTKIVEPKVDDLRVVTSMNKTVLDVGQ